MKRIIVIILLFMIFLQIRCVAQQIDDELEKLVHDANIEMEHSSEQVNRMVTGETLELIRKSHLELKSDSVLYVCLQKENIIKILNGDDNLKEKQMDVFMYGEMYPHFRLLIEYLINNGLSFYQVFQTVDGKARTQIIEYNGDYLRKFGSLADNTTKTSSKIFIPEVISKKSVSQNLGEAKVECPDTVRVGTQFTYSITIPVDNYFQEKVSPPFDIVDLNIVTGPSVSSFSKFSFVNGKQSKSYTKTYKYILEGKSEKFISIPSYTIQSRSNGNYYTVPQKTILCTKTHLSNNGAKQKRNTNRMSEEQQDSIFVLTTVDRKNISIDDSVLVTTRLYTTCDVSSLSIQQRLLPDFCVCQSIMEDSVMFLKQDTINGMECRAVTINSYWLHPCKTGIVEIPSNSFSIQTPDGLVDPLDAFFNDIAITYKTVHRKTNPVKIDVEPSPFMKHSMESDSWKERDGIVFALDISGSMGNTFDFSSSRLEMAKTIIRKSCYKATTIIPFAGNREPSIVYPLMSNVLDTIIQPKNDGTALYDLCMSVALDTINNYRDIIVLTDGNDNCSHISLKTLTQAMKKCGIRVNIVSINSERDSIQYKSLEPDTLLTIKNETPLKSDFIYLTKETEGIWERCTNEKEMARIIKQITAIPQRPYRRTDLLQTNEDIYYRLNHNYLKTQDL